MCAMAMLGRAASGDQHWAGSRVESSKNEMEHNRLLIDLQELQSLWQLNLSLLPIKSNNFKVNTAQF